MASEALCRHPTSEIDKPDLDGDIPAYEVVDFHAVTDFNVEKNVEALTIQSLLWTQKENSNCLQVAEYTNALDSPYFSTNAAFFQSEHD